MTQRDYIAFAEVIKEETEKVKFANRIGMEYEFNVGQLMGIERMARRMADLFRKDNERFNVDQFLHAAGISEGQ